MHLMKRYIKSSVLKSFRVILLIFLIASVARGEDIKYTISGYIQDKSTGEVLIGSTVYVEEISSGAQTNVYGFYSLTSARRQLHAGLQIHWLCNRGCRS